MAGSLPALYPQRGTLEKKRRVMVAAFHEASHRKEDIRGVSLEQQTFLVAFVAPSL